MPVPLAPYPTPPAPYTPPANGIISAFLSSLLLTKKSFHHFIIALWYQRGLAHLIEYGV